MSDTKQQQTLSQSFKQLSDAFRGLVLQVLIGWCIRVVPKTKDGLKFLECIEKYLNSESKKSE